MQLALALFPDVYAIFFEVLMILVSVSIWSLGFKGIPQASILLWLDRGCNHQSPPAACHRALLAELHLVIRSHPGQLRGDGLLFERAKPR